MDSDNSDNEGRRNNYAESEADEEDGIIHSDSENNENRVTEPQSEQNEEKEEEKKVVKPKRVIRNPQPKLNVETLKGPRGLKALDGYFKNIKYKGKGHEIDDLQVILKTYEHWCHRLFPKLPFDDCIKKLETLGGKKPVMTYIKKIRLGMEEDDDRQELNQYDQEADDIVEDNLTHNNTEDIFDRLVQERQSPAHTVTRIDEEDTPLTEEQLERIRINRELALERRRLRMQQAANNEQESSNTRLNTENEENTRERRESNDDSIGSNEQTLTQNNTVGGEQNLDEQNLSQNVLERRENREESQGNFESDMGSTTNEDYYSSDTMIENDSGLVNREVSINTPLIVAPSIKSNPENSAFKGPQEKLIIGNRILDDVTNEAVLVEVSQDSDPPSEVIMQELSQSSTNMLSGPRENVALHSSGPLNSSSNTEVDNMDVDN